MFSLPFPIAADKETKIRVLREEFLAEFHLHWLATIQNN
jgi:hypothetical protein